MVPEAPTGGSVREVSEGDWRFAKKSRDMRTGARTGLQRVAVRGNQLEHHDLMTSSNEGSLGTVKKQHIF